MSDDEIALRLAELLAYDPETGAITWRVARPRGRGIGDAAGSLDKSTGYRQVTLRIGGRTRRFLAHRLAFLLSAGAWPAFSVDHINGNRADNRWSNLRDVPHTVNTQNIHRARRHSQTGLQGVNYNPRANRYVSRITANGRKVVLGYFLTAQEAHEVYRKAKMRFHPLAFGQDNGGRLHVL